MTDLDSVLKSRDIILPTKVQIVKVVIFPLITYGYKSWTIKKAEHRRMLLLSGGGGGREDSRESLALQGDQTSQS